MTLQRPEVSLRSRHQKWRGYNLFQAARKLGLGTSLELCLDAGAAASYTSGDKWLDLSGNGYDFHRGDDGTTDGTEPTFNGTVGRLSGGEYWSFDGNDRFNYDSANETWMNNVHKDNAAFTFIVVIYFATFGARQYFLTTSQNSNDAGFEWRVESSGNVIFIINALGSVARANTIVDGATTGRWLFLAVSIDEAAGADGSFHFSSLTGAQTFDGTYSSPSAANADETFRIGARLGSGDLENGGRVGAVGAWSRALPFSEVNALFNAIRGRFNV